jgi:hypothetical protein
VTKLHSIPWQSPYRLEAVIGFPITSGSLAEARRRFDFWKFVDSDYW